jgi:hypothetical protein
MHTQINSEHIGEDELFLMSAKKPFPQKSLPNTQTQSESEATDSVKIPKGAPNSREMGASDSDAETVSDTEDSTWVKEFKMFKNVVQALHANDAGDQGDSNPIEQSKNATTRTEDSEWVQDVKSMLQALSSSSSDAVKGTKNDATNENDAKKAIEMKNRIDMSDSNRVSLGVDVGVLGSGGGTDERPRDATRFVFSVCIRMCVCPCCYVSCACMYAFVTCMRMDDNNVANVDSGDSGEKNNVNMRRHEK